MHGMDAAKGARPNHRPAHGGIRAMKKNVFASALVIGVLSVPAVSHAGASGNIGYVSDYIFRGVFQADSSAYAGADYSGDSGVYVGTWWADVNQGTETDVYFGWQGGNDNVKFKVGYTGYRYLDDFDGDYDEINLGLYAGIFSLDVAVGTYDSDKIWGLGDQDYVFTSVMLAPKKGPYYKIGMWSGDIVDNIFPLLNKTGDNVGDYLEVGYSYKLEDAGVDLSAALIYSDDLPLAAGAFGVPSAGDYTITFGIKKTFEPKK
jgi:uncharacterized protein (TIGR02001 family)